MKNIFLSFEKKFPNLKRSNHQKIIWGVCSGISDRYRFSLVFVRFFFALFAFIFYGIPIVYFLAAILIPSKNKEEDIPSQIRENLIRQKTKDSGAPFVFIIIFFIIFHLIGNILMFLILFIVFIFLGNIIKENKENMHWESGKRKDKDLFSQAFSFLEQKRKNFGNKIQKSNTKKNPISSKNILESSRYSSQKKYVKEDISSFSFEIEEKTSRTPFFIGVGTLLTLIGIHFFLSKNGWTFDDVWNFLGSISFTENWIRETAKAGILHFFTEEKVLKIDLIWSLTIVLIGLIMIFRKWFFLILFLGIIFGMGGVMYILSVLR